MINIKIRGEQFLQSKWARFSSGSHTKKLLRRRPELRNIEKEQATARQELLPFYDNYIHSISTDGMAVSLELATFCLALCRLMKPKRILDLGSGFSSFVFRRYTKEAGGEVVSVDDDARWLGKTQQYLAKEQLSVQNLFEWSNKPAVKGEFDLVLHDLGNRYTRGDVLPDIYALAAKNGVIILDDFHKPDYAVRVKKFIVSQNNQFYSVYKYTIDKFARYSVVVIKQ